MPNVYLVYHSGEHEDWPIAIFRDEDTAVYFIDTDGSPYLGYKEVAWDEAVRQWTELYKED